MDVGVEKTGAEDLVIAIDDAGVIWCGNASGNFTDDAFFDQDVCGKRLGR